jgi:hypothetical protein
MISLRSGMISMWGWMFLLVWHAHGQEQVPDSLLRADSKNLPNAIWVHATVMSGGLPAGKTAFEELAQLGVKTVISVDGIRPDVDRAEAAGLRYIHLPHGYDGISEERLLQIAKAVRDLPGPVYIHCHHGKHRSPAAAAAVCISLGRIAPAQGLELLKLAGTNPGFRGLIRAVEQAVPMTDDRLDQIQVDFVSSSKVPPLVNTMVEMDSIMERLKDFQEESWELGCRVVAASEALMLKEHYIELHRSESALGRDHEFLELLAQGRHSAEKLENLLQRNTEANFPEDAVHYGVVMRELIGNCLQCHQRYRDNP